MDDADLTDRRAEFEETQLAKVRAAQSIATLEYKECRHCEEALTEARQRADLFGRMQGRLRTGSGCHAENREAESLIGRDVNIASRPKDYWSGPTGAPDCLRD